ncbi:MAG: hypothetical protein ACRDXX_17360, partial [Stackebrandtia sp.]
MDQRDRRLRSSSSDDLSDSSSASKPLDTESEARQDVFDSSGPAATAAAVLDPPPPPPPAAPPSQARSPWAGLALAYAIVAGGGVVFVALGAQAAGWGWTQFSLAYDSGYSPLLWPGISAAVACVVALACLPFWFMRRFPRLRGTGMAWTAAAAVAALLGLSRLIPVAAGG